MSLQADTNFTPVPESFMLLDSRPVLRARGIVVPSRPAARPEADPDARAEQIAVISHELRNSLSVVRNAARLLQLPVGAAGIEAARVLIERHVGQMSRHIADLFDMSRISHRNEPLHLAHVDLRTIVGHSIDAIEPDARRRGHRLAVELPADALWINADGARLEQVFTNLLINAAKYTPDGGDITVVMECVEGIATVRIRDSGIGIVSAMLDRVFDMYVQADANAPCAEGGRGIGLAVVRNLVELHEGSVCATSAGLGRGSEFTVQIPVLSSQNGARLPDECS